MQCVPVGVKRTRLESGNGAPPHKDQTLHIYAYCMATWLTACAPHAALSCQITKFLSVLGGFEKARTLLICLK